MEHGFRGHVAVLEFIVPSDYPLIAVSNGRTLKQWLYTGLCAINPLGTFYG